MTLLAELSPVLTISLIKLAVVIVVLGGGWLILQWMRWRMLRSEDGWILVLVEALNDCSPEELAAKDPELMNDIANVLSEFEADERAAMLSEFPPTRQQEIEEYLAKHRSPTKDEVT